ncbi:ribonuclease 3 [Aplysia californica]|uniref:Ribonuclease 3 n=1 Tax=Aplysia californica TaxID=6500 RepID=A0ABM0K2J3_APLCA|nr:ribonuclease 3 [Aplysia californica]
MRNNSRRTDLPNNANNAAMGRGGLPNNPALLQQQQFLLQQREQFLLRQQIIQREQLQRQRILRQQELLSQQQQQQQGLGAAISQLQQKTREQQQMQGLQQGPWQQNIPPSVRPGLAPASVAGAPSRLPINPPPLQDVIKRPPGFVPPPSATRDIVGGAGGGTVMGAWGNNNSGRFVTPQQAKGFAGGTVVSESMVKPHVGGFPLPLNPSQQTEIPRSSSVPNLQGGATSYKNLQPQGSPASEKMALAHGGSTFRKPSQFFDSAGSNSRSSSSDRYSDRNSQRSVSSRRSESSDRFSNRNDRKDGRGWQDSPRQRNCDPDQYGPNDSSRSSRYSEFNPSLSSSRDGGRSGGRDWSSRSSSRERSAHVLDSARGGRGRDFSRVSSSRDREKVPHGGRTPSPEPRSISRESSRDRESLRDRERSRDRATHSYGADRSRSERGSSEYNSSRRSLRSPRNRSPRDITRSQSQGPRDSSRGVSSSSGRHMQATAADFRTRDSSPSAGSRMSNAETTGADDLVVEEDETVIYFTRSCPADLYFTKQPGSGDTQASSRMIELENRFEEEVVRRAERMKASQPQEKETSCESNKPHHHHHHHHHHCSGHKSGSSSSESSSDEDDDDDDDDEGANQIMEEWEKRKKHPYSLHPELWFNIKGQANDGPLCRCSIKSRKSGIRHDIYPGEEPLPVCDPESNNLGQLWHYRVTLSPSTNLLTRVPTLIQHDDHEYIFEGFSIFSHKPLEHVPPCRLLRFNIEYTIRFLPEAPPENFTVRSLNLLGQFLFSEILELIDMDWSGPGGGCQRFHLLPRFSRTLPDSGCKEVLSMNTVLSFLLRSARMLVEEKRVEELLNCGDEQWRTFVDEVRGMIVTSPGMRPSSLRIDQLDRKMTEPSVPPSDDPESASQEKGAEKESKQDREEKQRFPLIIHQGYRPAQLSYAGDPAYRKAWKQYVKFRHLLNSKPKILADDKQRLKEQEERLQEIRMKKTMKREVTVELSSQNFLLTGLRADVCQHALMMPVLMSHLRFHLCLDVLENTLDYKFIDRTLLQLSLTHTSYRTNYGTNPDHTRNSLTNCGMRQVEYGDRRVHYQNTRKRGICILVDIMSRMGKQEETTSEIPHNERLEFLGDAVIEFLTSVHLFYMFPWLEEGGLTTYRMALVQNQHLALLAKKLKLQEFMLYVHGPDLCHESDLRHAMANCCEALMGALFLDGGIDVADKIFSGTLFDDEDVLLGTWNDLPQHVLQQEEPAGDRHWVKSSPILKKLETFEEAIGVKFTHIRLLAKAFTHRNIGVNPLTHGHNQRLEFLGDTVLQLVASEYLYKHYPEHHEGHLSLLRSSLVNSRTQGLVYDDLGMSEYVIFNENAVSDGIDMKTKQRADILESFVGSLFVDKGLDYCRTFCNVCFFPRLKDFILNQDWNDPKSQLQQCCLTLREVGGGEPDIPIYKVIESIGPTNTRKYVVAVYFRGSRLSTGTGHSIQQAEMAAATNALKKRAELFPILQHQRRFLERMRKDAGGDQPPEKKLRKNRPNQRRRKGTKKGT